MRPVVAEHVSGIGDPNLISGAGVAVEAVRAVVHRPLVHPLPSSNNQRTISKMSAPTAISMVVVSFVNLFPVGFVVGL
jgi:hypothetical protein